MSKVVKILYKNNIPVSNSCRRLLTDPNFFQLYKQDTYLNDMENYSSYNNFKNTYEEGELLKYCNKFYTGIILDILKQYNLRLGSEYHFNYWWQVYNNKTTGHKDHTHFDSKSPTIFSFVHFINMDDNDPCFHFVNEDNSEEYINEKTNDFVLFGSWSRHRVKQPTSEINRAVIAGNITIPNHISSRQFYGTNQ